MSETPADDVIHSARNPRVKALVRLRERRERERSGTLLIEGARETSRALAAGWRITEAFLAADLLRDDGVATKQQLQQAGVPVRWLGEAAFRRASLRQGPDGVLAVARTPSVTLADLSTGSEALYLIAVGTEKPGNLGALLRSAEAAGVTALIVCPEDGEGTDPWNPAVIRASMGACFRLPVVRSSAEQVLAWAQQQEVRLVATMPHAERELWDADLTGRVALMVGPEHEGLPGRWSQEAALQVRIPMLGSGVDSLNVSVSAALVLYESLRQRRAGMPVAGDGP